MSDMIVRVYFREEVLLPNNRRERVAWRSPPAGHKPYLLDWHERGVRLENEGKVYIYPYSMVEFVDVTQPVVVIPDPPESAVAFDSKAKKGRKNVTNT